MLIIIIIIICASVDSAASVALESNINRSIHFSLIVINAQSILSLKLRYISFLKEKIQRTNSDLYSVWLIHGRITASGVRVFLLKSTDT